MSTSFSQLKKFCLYILIAGLLLVQAGFSPRPMTARAAPLAVGISYVGLDKVHLTYDTSVCNSSGDPQEYWELTVTTNGSSPVVLANGASFSYQGTKNHTGIAKTDKVLYELSVRRHDRYYYLPCGDPSGLLDFSTMWQIGGTLLFDETINGNPDWNPLRFNITVPAGKTLSLGNLTNCDSCNVTVYGTLNITGPVTFSSSGSLPEIKYYSPIQQSLPSPFSLIFMPGSEGSAMSGDGAGSLISVQTQGGSPVSVSGNNWSVNIDDKLANLEIHDAHNFTLSGNNNPEGTVNIVNSEGTNAVGIGGSGQLNITQSILKGGVGNIRGSGLVNITQSTWNGPLTFDLNDHATLKMDGVEVDRYLMIDTASSSSSFEIKNSFILGYVRVNGPAQGVFSGNEVEGDDVGSMDIGSGVNLTVSDNVLIGAINFSGSSIPTNLTIDNNSFDGPGGLQGTYDTPGSISIGANYYGDKAGPHQGSDWTFLASRGVGSSIPITPGNWKTTGEFPSGGHFFPKIWLINYIIGQNTIPHVLNGYGSRMVLGRKTLVSLDIGVSAQTLSGLDVYAVLDGIRIYAEPFGDLHRDSGDYKASEIEQGKSTVNIILPEVLTSTANLEVFADTFGVAGPDQGRPAGDKLTLLPSTSLSFTEPQSLSMEVVPIDLGGFCPRRVALTQGTLEVLTDDLPQRFPVPQSLVSVVTRPSFYYFCIGNDLSQRYFVSNLLARVALSSKLGYNPVQRTVAVAPGGSLGSGTSGATIWYTRNTILVDESKPMAALHELGHTVGLYLDTEQYDLPAYQTDGGIPLVGVTAFSPEGSIWVGGKHGLVIHFPSSNAWWYNRNFTVYDIMSSWDSVWPIQSTLSRLDFAPLTPAPQPVRPADASSGASAGTRQVFLWGLMQSDGHGYYHGIPGSAQVFDITGIPPERWKVSQCRQTIPGVTPMYWYVTDSLGGYLGGTMLGTEYPDPSLAPIEAFCKVMNVDMTGATRMTLGEFPNDTSLMNETRSVSLPTLSSHPASGSSLGNQVALGWTGGSGSPLYWVWFSPDGGATWQPAGLPVADPSLSFSTDFLPAGNNILIQAFTSDGFQQSMQQIDGLTLANRPPQVSINAPFESISAPPGTAWDLAGYAYDLEDGVDITSAWASSLDGVLGLGNTLLGVTLSPGNHTLTFTATDKAGLSASVQRHVSVGAVTQADLGLTQSSLTLQVAGSDPMLSAPLNLTLGAGHTLELQVQGMGVPIDATLALFITAPGGTETLLKRQDLSIEAFSIGVLQASLTPTVPGGYHIRAAIEASSLPDPNEANNQFTWTYSTSSSESKIYLPLVVR